MEDTRVVIKQDSLVVKSNYLVEARYKLTTNEQRIILIMASMIKSEDDDFCTCRLKISELVKVLDSKNKRVHSDIKKATESLIKKVMTIKKAKSVLQVSWLSSAEYFYQEGYVNLRFDPALKPFLLNLKEQFVKFPLSNVLSLRGSYAIRIYQLLKQYQNLKKRVMEVSELRSLLGINPVEYKLYGHFKERIILSTKKEFDDNESIDLTFEFNEIKKSRKVVAIEFIIISKKSKKTQEQFELSNASGSSLVEKLKKYNVSLNKIIQNMLQDNPAHVERCIEFYEYEKCQGREKKNPGGFICDCISGKIEIPEHIQTKAQKHKKKVIEANKQNKAMEMTRLYDAFFDQYNLKADNLIQQRQIKASDLQFKQWMKKNHLIEFENHYNAGRFPAMEIIKPFLREYVMEGQPGEICEFEIWIKDQKKLVG